MDSRGGKTKALAAAGGLTRLAAATGAEFPALFDAREDTSRELEKRRRALQDVERDEDVAVVLMGSWGRLEATAESDDDYMCLVEGERRPAEEVRPSVEEAWRGMGSEGKLPGEEDIFGVPAFSAELRTIGLEDDGNKNLTRRMLLLLESKWALGEDTFRRVKRDVLEDYLRDLDKDYHPPRFLLNDVFRYWRTIAVDFERKHRDRSGKEWGLRNAKLRTSRQVAVRQRPAASARMPPITSGRIRPFPGRAVRRNARGSDRLLLPPPQAGGLGGPDPAGLRRLPGDARR